MSPTADDFDKAARRKEPKKPRPKGTLPFLPDELEAEALRDWLTLALRPPAGWRVHSFERAGRQRTDACMITIRSGRESQTFDFESQADLFGKLRPTVLAVTDGVLAIRHLTVGEIEDVWHALVALGTVLSTYDQRDEARKWAEALVESCEVLSGLSLVPDVRRDALMALRRRGEFRRGDAMALVRGEDRWVRRPVRFIDSHTHEQWVRAGEAATFARWVLGAEPLSHATLRARWAQIDVVPRLFEDWSPPHPKLTLYRLSEPLIEYAESVVSGPK